MDFAPQGRVRQTLARHPRRHLRLNHHPFVSVIMPVYNGAKLLHEAIASIVAQSTGTVEIIVVDDGSTDGTAQIITDLCATATLIRYARQENSGPSAARNRGVQCAAGEFIAFLDADDLWDHDKLAVQLPLLTASQEVQIVWGKVQEFSIESQQQIALGPPHHGPHVGGLLMRRAAFAEVGPFDEQLRHGEDLDWFLRSRELRLPAITHPETVLWYRHHADNTWLGKQDTFGSDLAAFVKKRLAARRANQTDASPQTKSRSAQ